MPWRPSISAVPLAASRSTQPSTVGSLAISGFAGGIGTGPGAALAVCTVAVVSLGVGVAATGAGVAAAGVAAAGAAATAGDAAAVRSFSTASLNFASLAAG